jgi:phosphoribosylaminoimidazole-succinocarboxamide synthase
VPSILLQSDLPGLDLIHRGKVRDVYALPDNELLIVATDRLSAFDVVLPDPVPGKGEMLTRLSNFWFAMTAHLMPNHLVERPITEVLLPGVDISLCPAQHRQQAPAGPFEAIARLSDGSGWKDIRAARCGITCRAACVRPSSCRPIFTPSTVAVGGMTRMAFAAGRQVGQELATQVRDATLAIYSFAAAYAATRGILIADTKLEFGTDVDGKLYVMDEMLTPDSSRFWPAEEYRVGISPPSYDKQFVRDYLETLDWNKQAPGPSIPAPIIEATAAKYAEALDRLAGIRLD